MVSSTTRGAADMPHWRFVAPLSSRMFVRHTSAPVVASRQRSSPRPPSANTRPAAQTGVARGPVPPIDSWNVAVHALVHSSRPVATSYAATISWGPRCSIVKARPPAMTNDAYPPPTGCFQIGFSPSAGQLVRIGRSR